MGNIIQAQKGESFFDPACGSGEFISEIIKNQVAISGSEYDVDRLKISKMKMLVKSVWISCLLALLSKWHSTVVSRQIIV
ncbi:SAM-dependent methyltransferase [Salmonella enterica]|uniref:SAM-dependent methyltransferase n=1 Tax=Salmonella enterica TaxID=28901 RepID=UPI001E4272C3